MSIRSQFKQTSLILACLTTLLPAMASAALTSSKQINLTSLTDQPLNHGLSVTVADLNANDFFIGTQSISPSAALERDKEAAARPALAFTRSAEAGGIILPSITPTRESRLELALSTVAGILGYEDSVAPLTTGATPTGPLVSDNALRAQAFLMPQPESATAQDTDIRLHRASVPQLVVVEFRGQEAYGFSPLVFFRRASIQTSQGVLASTLPVSKANSRFVLQLAPGVKLNAANVTAAVNGFQTMVSVAPTSGGVTFKTPGLWANSLAADEAITHSSPKALYVMDAAVDKNGNLTANATKFVSSIPITAGDSAIVVGSPAAATATTKALMASGVAATRLRTVSLFQPTPMELAMDGMTGASAAGSSAAAGSVTTGSTAANTQMVAVQVVHQPGLQDLARTNPAAALTEQNS